MEFSFIFFFNSIFLGVGLAMDAFSVSLANGLNEPKMGKSRMGVIAGTFAFFQALMPMLGWICVHTIVQYFKSFQSYIPWIALALLLFIGGKMLIEGIKNSGEGETSSSVGIAALILQGIATSIDALSVGFTISDYGLIMALICSMIIAAVTFFICMAGLLIGKRFGTKFSNKATILGGIVLIAIGIEIFITGI
ncbi:MAG: manganese efflux pump MntP family protein [Oscillospiraceae bacterium]|nr:manganese efflux pump MntP family protein [Oscillospiraceae bacterium]